MPYHQGVVPYLESWIRHEEFHLHGSSRVMGWEGTGVEASVKEGVLREARRWFALPLEQKLRIALRPETQYRGYQQLGDNVTRYDGGFQRDWHEAIDLYREVDPSLPQVQVPAKGPPTNRCTQSNPWDQG